MVTNNGLILLGKLSIQPKNSITFQTRANGKEISSQSWRKIKTNDLQKEK